MQLAAFGIHLLRAGYLHLVRTDDSACDGGFKRDFAAVMASIFLPALESWFKITTDMRLLELSNLNAPLLKRLSVEAPGTYHHSLMVGALAEAAAETIGANPLLMRAAAYYHDVGKVLKPEYI